jgi:hypothetical protein
LQVGFIVETSFPAKEGRDSPIADKVVSLFSDGPRCYDEEFYEKNYEQFVSWHLPS